MEILRLSVGLVLFCVALGLFAEDPVHVVRRGDTVYSLARQYGVGVEQILVLNGIADPRRIQEGQRLRIPQSATAGPVPAVQGGGSSSQDSRYIEYQAVRGDNLYSLARRYGATVEAIRQASGFTVDQVLRTGDRLRIPRPEEQPAGRRQENAVVSRSPARTPVSALLWPVRAQEVAYMTGKMNGVVLLGERSEPVKSLTQGTVVYAGPYRGFGRVAIIQAAGGYYYVYGGCESLSVREGGQVAAGAELGRLGIDGVSSKPQLFFMVYRNNTPIDPAIAPRS
jgi:murein DD-endopeptidase MepM/ murein hydrolase activator NlpD